MKERILVALAALMILLLVACQAPAAGESAANSIAPPSDSMELPSDFFGPSVDLLESVRWSFDAASGTLTFSGTGALSGNELKTADHLNYEWSVLAGEATAIVIGEGITRIPNLAFYGFSKVTEVSMPSTLKSIGDYAFFQCAFSEITLPTGLESLGSGAFSNCEQLMSCDIPGGVTVLPAAAFENCTNLQNISLWEGVERLEETCLYGCDRISSLVIPVSVTSIGELYTAIKVFVFLGEPPELPKSEDTGEYLLFYGDATVYYPEGSKAWKDLSAQCTQDEITWIEGIPKDGE